jgi:hypothetical protein
MSLRRIFIVFSLGLTPLLASYVIEWSASLNYGYATAYTSNRTMSYDANGDSLPDVFVTDSSSLKVYSGATRGLIWTINGAPYTTLGFPYIANTDGDANRELVMSGSRYDQSYVYHGKFFVYDCQSHNLE